jgi:mono/diheme cytochrome c family protein
LVAFFTASPRRAAIRRLCLAGLACAAVLAACRGDDLPERLTQGELVYIQECATCHQPDGQGYSHIYPPLAGNPIVTLHDPDLVIQIVLHGRGSMPGFKRELKVDELADVVTFIRQSWGNNASSVEKTQVK